MDANGRFAALAYPYRSWHPGAGQVQINRPRAGRADRQRVDEMGVSPRERTDLIAVGALTSVYPARVPLQGARLVNDVWEPLPVAELRDERFNIGARPYLSGWVGGVLLTWTDSGSDPGRTMTYHSGSDSWAEIDSVPLSGSEGWPEPISIDERLLVFHHGHAAIYNPVADSRSLVNIPFAEAGRAAWTGSEVLFRGGVCCYGTGGLTPFEVEAWRYTAPAS
jgi:hypothetical protein